MCTDKGLDPTDKHGTVQLLKARPGWGANKGYVRKSRKWVDKTKTKKYQETMVSKKPRCKYFKDRVHNCVKYWILTTEFGSTVIISNVLRIVPGKEEQVNQLPGGGRGRTGLLMFAHFHGVNILNFRLPTVYWLTQNSWLSDNQFLLAPVSQSEQAPAHECQESGEQRTQTRIYSEVVRVKTEPTKELKTKVWDSSEI